MFRFIKKDLLKERGTFIMTTLDQKTITAIENHYNELNAQRAEELGLELNKSYFSVFGTILAVSRKETKASTGRKGIRYGFKFISGSGDTKKVQWFNVYAYTDAAIDYNDQFKPRSVVRVNYSLNKSGRPVVDWIFDARSHKN